MTATEQSAIIVDLAVQLRNNGSWAGETHVQKAAFLLQELLGVPVGFKFVLYKHGPFSFDLRETLNQMEADRQIRLEEQPYPYGPKIVEGEGAPVLRKKTNAAARYGEQIGFVAAQLGSSSVSALERIATALFVTLDSSIPANRRVERLVQLKPHVQMPDAAAAFERLAEIRAGAAESGLNPVGVPATAGFATI
jgi:hypothetical protein